MKAVGTQRPLPIDDPLSLLDITLPQPVATGRDLLVRVAAVSVNPVDTKVRKSATPAEGEYRVLGWDASGIVEAVGPQVRLFKPGDAVFYAGAIGRSGTNAQYHLVDERIVGPKPASLSHSEAAALPLTAITAWEALFDRLEVARPVPGAANALLVIGGAGGVGSMAIQLARSVPGLIVIATASRPETKEWVTGLGAHHVVDHTKPLAEQIAGLGLGGAPAFVFSTTQTHEHFDAIVEVIAPQGRFALIDDPESIDVRKLKRKSVSLHWELMFTRSLFETPDLIRQHELLAEVSKRVDAGQIRTTLAEDFGVLDAANLRRAHALIESGKARGKIVLRMP
jgi:zinc-binding alcohol dehydrogenase family protein